MVYKCPNCDYTAGEAGNCPTCNAPTEEVKEEVSSEPQSEESSEESQESEKEE